MTLKTYKGWHWLRMADDFSHGVLAHGDGRSVYKGERLTVDGEPKPAEWGLHFATSPLFAFQVTEVSSERRYALCEVVSEYVWEQPSTNEAGQVLCAASARTVLRWADANKVLRAALNDIFAVGMPKAFRNEELYTSLFCWNQAFKYFVELKTRLYNIEYATYAVAHLLDAYRTSNIVGLYEAAYTQLNERIIHHFNENAS